MDKYIKATELRRQQIYERLSQIEQILTDEKTDEEAFIRRIKANSSKKRNRVGITIAACLAFFFGESCSKPAAPVANDPTKSVLVIDVPGLGSSQMGDMDAAIRERCPLALVVPAENYRNDLHAIIAEHRRPTVAVVSHSFGCQSAAQLGNDAALLVLLDPVSPDGSIIGVSVANCIYFRRTNFGVEVRATVTGATPINVPKFHNDIPHDPAIISSVCDAINKL